MKKEIENIKIEIENFINVTFEEKIKNKISFIQSIILGSIIASFLFLINSNAFIENNNGQDYTTPLFEKKKIENTDVELRARKYDSSNKTVEFYFYAYDSYDINNNILEFDLKEKNNPLENIQTDVRRIDRNNYIVRAKLPSKKWSVLSVSVSIFEPLKIEKEEKEQEVNYDTNTNNQNKISIKFYSEQEDMEKVNSLKEKTSNEYLAEGLTLEIKNIDNIFVTNNKLIEEKNQSIDLYNENINKLKEDMVYQTDNEKIETNNKINGIKSKIEQEEKQIQKLLDDNKEYKEKKKMLEQKRKELLQK